jgi:class 3 adenylate cyclase/tetratricopeptide (TPR) repeat protein
VSRTSRPMKCAACQARNRVGAEFCSACGERLDAACLACGSRLGPRDRFCDRCGLAVAASAQPRVGFDSPRKYLPRHLAERVLAGKTALEGERKRVTILLADVKGSLELLADHDPEDARKVLDPVLLLMMDAVHHYEGTVNQVMGDGIMALFGAPIAHEDHAVRACYAALRIQETLGRNGESRMGSAGMPIQVRIGINSGDVVVRAIGSDLAMDYTAIGTTVHLAGRLEQMASPGTVLCTDATLRLAEGFVRVRRLGTVPIKGLTAPVEIAEIVGAEPIRTRFQTAIARGLSPFVGRDNESETLRRALEQVKAGAGHLISLVGDPGVGKSRLCWELSRIASEDGWRVLETGGLSYGRSFPYGPVVALLRRYLNVDDRGEARALREHVASRLLALYDSPGPTWQAVMALLDLSPADPEWVDLDPLQRKLRINTAVSDLLRRESRQQPVLLVLEDLHWVDEETLALLDECAEDITADRVLILTTRRPDYQRVSRRGRPRTELHIRPLARPDAAALLNALVGVNPQLEPLKTTLLDRTSGNALFLEEMVRTLVETGVLCGEPGDYDVRGDLRRVEVPVSVHSILAARIDRLPAEQKALLETMAAAGGDIAFALVRGVSKQSDDRLRASLNRLRDAGFLAEVRLYPELAYGFCHELVREVTYRSMVQDRRRSLHAQILLAAEELYAERRTERAPYLAHHALEGEVWGKAVTYGREAGSRAAGRSAYRDAVEHFERSLSVLARLPETRENRGLAIDLRFELRNALFPLGEVPRDLENLLAAMPIAEKLGDKQRLAWLLAYVARDYSLLGEPQRALELGARARTIAEAIGDHDLEVLTDAYLGSAHYAMGQYARAASLLRRCCVGLPSDRRLQRLGLPGPASVFFASWLVWALARLGHFSEGAQHAHAAIEIAAAAEQPLSLAVASYSSGVFSLHRNDLHAAIAMLERALELCHQWELRAWFPNIAAGLGEAYTRAGRLEEGRILLEQAVEQTEALGVLTGHAYEVAMLADNILLSGDVEAAQRLARRASEVALNYREQGNAAVVMRVLGDIVTKSEPEEALVYYQRAIEGAGELGMRPLLVQCHARLADVYQRCGEHSKAVKEAKDSEELRRALEIPQPLTLNIGSGSPARV